MVADLCAVVVLACAVRVNVALPVPEVLLNVSQGWLLLAHQLVFELMPNVLVLLFSGAISNELLDTVRYDVGAES